MKVIAGSLLVLAGSIYAVAGAMAPNFLLGVKVNEWWWCFGVPSSVLWIAGLGIVVYEMFARDKPAS